MLIDIIITAKHISIPRFRACIFGVTSLIVTSLRVTSYYVNKKKKIYLVTCTPQTSNNQTRNTKNTGSYLHLASSIIMTKL